MSAHRRPDVTAAQVRARIAAGDTQADICRRYGCDERMVRRRLAELPVRPRAGRVVFTPAVQQRLVALADGQHRTPEIVAILTETFGQQFTRGGVIARMRRLGLRRARQGGGTGMVAGSYRKRRMPLDAHGCDAGAGFDWCDLVTPHVTHEHCARVQSREVA